MSYSKDYSKCAKCGSVKDISCIWCDGDYFSICYDCFIELLKKELDLQIEEVDGKKVFFTRKECSATRFLGDDCNEIEEETKSNSIAEFLGKLCFDDQRAICEDDTLCCDCNGTAKKYFIIYDQEEGEDVTICPTCLSKRLGAEEVSLKNFRSKILYNGELVASEEDNKCFEDWVRFYDTIINYCVDNLGLKVEQLPIEYTSNMKLIYMNDNYVPPIFFKVIG
ncbi:MAG: hypothetical protein U0J50_08740 [Peptacetobacter hiranonis]|nr:hypothetical protein [Peptacetobacter hiranonis]